MREQDIAYEARRAWVLKDKRGKCYTVMVPGATHSTSDSSYALTDDGLSLAKARADYLSRRFRVYSISGPAPRLIGEFDTAAEAVNMQFRCSFPTSMGRADD